MPISGPSALAVGRRQIWVASQGAIRDVGALGNGLGSYLCRVKIGSGRVCGSPIKLARTLEPPFLAADEYLWAAQPTSQKSRSLRRLDAASGRTLARVPNLKNLVGVDASGASAWVIDFGGDLGKRPRGRGRVLRIDARTDRAVSSVRVGRGPARVAHQADTVWVTNNLDGTVSRIDSHDHRVVKAISVGRDPVGIEADAHGVWVANFGSATVSRIDSASNRVVATVRVGRGPRDVAIGSKAVWVTNELDDTVSQIDPNTNRVIHTIRVGAGPTSIVAAYGAVWVANNQDRSISRLDPSRF